MKFEKYAEEEARQTGDYMHQATSDEASTAMVTLA